MLRKHCGRYRQTLLFLQQIEICCVPRMNLGFFSILIFLFTSAGSIFANIELQTIPQVEARCEENVTLICHASFLNQSDVKIVKFSWVGDTGRSCVYEGNNTESCKSKSKASQYELTLILTDIKPIHEGTYFCKIHSSIGMQSKKTKVVVKDCRGSAVTSRNDTRATCSFKGIYPSGMVHWFQGDTNVTDDASTQEEKDQNGFYDYQSAIAVRKVNVSQPLTCSLWIPSNGKYAFREEIYSKSQTVNSAETTVWICIVAQIIMISVWI